METGTGRPPRVALCGIILESNRWAKPAARADFESLTWASGADLLDEARGEAPSLAIEFASFVRAMDATGPWAPVPLFLGASHPAGPVEEALFEEMCGRIVEGAQAAMADPGGPLDAVYVCNHGAMVAAHLDDPDGALVARLREAVGEGVRIVMTLDLHANISPAMVEATDLIVGYRTNPHVDMIERGEEAAMSLRLMLAGRADPRAVLVKPPIAPASVTLLTAEGPYADLIDYGQRRQAEEGGRILNVSVFGNFIFADVPENTLSIVVTARCDPEAARMLADEIAAKAWAERYRFRRELVPVRDAVALALEPDRAPVIFSDAGDNPGGGGSGRTTELLRALGEAGAEGVLYGSFCDPELAAEAHEKGVGAVFPARFNRSAGGDAWEAWDAALEVEAMVDALGEGEVTGRLGMTAGRRMHLGKTALLRLGGVNGGIRVVVISDRTQTADPVFFEMLGADPGEARTVVVKSRGHFRAGFRPWFPPERVFEIDTGGLTSPVLARWPFERVPRPSYPLDEDAVWDEAPAPAG